jgi:hypothetical protein
VRESRRGQQPEDALQPVKESDEDLRQAEKKIDDDGREGRMSADCMQCSAKSGRCSKKKGDNKQANTGGETKRQ